MVRERRDGGRRVRCLTCCEDLCFAVSAMPAKQEVPAALAGQTHVSTLGPCLCRARGFAPRCRLNAVASRGRLQTKTLLHFLGYRRVVLGCCSVLQRPPFPAWVLLILYSQTQTHPRRRIRETPRDKTHKTESGDAARCVLFVGVEMH